MLRLGRVDILFHCLSNNSEDFWGHLACVLHSEVRHDDSQPTKYVLTHLGATLPRVPRKVGVNVLAQNDQVEK